MQAVRAQVVEVAQETARLPRWDIMFNQLNENGVKSIRAKEAQQLIKKGYVSETSLPLLLLYFSYVWPMLYTILALHTSLVSRVPRMPLHAFLLDSAQTCLFCTDLLACRKQPEHCKLSVKWIASLQVLVDVRPPHIYEKAHPEGAVNVPLFQKFAFRNFSIPGYLRAAALALNGVEPVEPNPNFGA